MASPAYPYVLYQSPQQQSPKQHHDRTSQTAFNQQLSQSYTDTPDIIRNMAGLMLDNQQQQQGFGGSANVPSG